MADKKGARKTKKSAQLSKRVRHTVIGIVASIVLAFLGIYIFTTGVIPMTIVALNSHNIRQNMKEARSELEPASDKEQSERIAALYDAGVIDSDQSTYSTKVDICYLFETHVKIYTTTDWTQKCFIRHYDLMETSLTRDEILQKLSGNSSINTLFGAPFTYPTNNSSTCDSLYQREYLATLSLLDLSRGNNTQCHIYDASHNDFGQMAIHVIRSVDPNTVDRTKSYLTIENDSPYFHHSIGCGKPGLFGCASPVKDPITDF